MRSIKRILKIHNIEDYKIYCLFNNGESRIIDFEKLFKEWDVTENDPEYPLSKSLSEFRKVELSEGTFRWKNIEIKSLNEDDNETTYFYELDPIVLYEASVLDSRRNPEIAILIKQFRKQLGLTQQELAEKSGTTKHHISRIENNKSGIELSTLTRIVEGGFGKRLEIRIH